MLAVNFSGNNFSLPNGEWRGMGFSFIIPTTFTLSAKMFDFLPRITQVYTKPGIFDFLNYSVTIIERFKI